jgi:hypothetical protein
MVSDTKPEVAAGTHQAGAGNGQRGAGAGAGFELTRRGTEILEARDRDMVSELPPEMVTCLLVRLVDGRPVAPLTTSWLYTGRCGTAR